MADGARVARRAARRSMLLLGAYCSLSVASIDVVRVATTLSDGARAMVAGAVAAVFGLVWLRLDRSASVRARPGSRQLLLAAGAAVVVGAAATAVVGPVATAGAVFAVWIVAGWWVGR